MPLLKYNDVLKRPKGVDSQQVLSLLRGLWRLVLKFNLESQTFPLITRRPHPAKPVRLSRGLLNMAEAWRISGLCSKRVGGGTVFMKLFTNFLTAFYTKSSPPECCSPLVFPHLPGEGRLPQGNPPCPVHHSQCSVHSLCRRPHASQWLRVFLVDITPHTGRHSACRCRAGLPPEQHLTRRSMCS